jgi:hypothetical protein
VGWPIQPGVFGGKISLSYYAEDKKIIFSRSKYE